MNMLKKSLLLAAFGLLAATGINSASAADIHKDYPNYELQQHKYDVKKADTYNKENSNKETHNKEKAKKEKHKNKQHIERKTDCPLQK
ncbi:MAG: hypothetical protein HUJ83_00015 [Veillonella sp.]|uniref:hypothetical protein n=1 Tax=Veillonella caviae TaxID=248316 RepID=UPI000F8F11FF|nr:hypothetical protein [Veillonella caviae]MCF0156888.1 hypothetical protein [Veillonella sp.]